MSDIKVIYYSNHSRNTERFASKLEHPASRIEDGIESECILIVPTYGRAAVPVVVVKALKERVVRERVRAVIGTGNINFGENYCAGARKLANALDVPLLYTLELAGIPEDVDRVNTIIKEFSRATV